MSNVVHSNSPQGQLDWFRDEAAKWKRKGASVKNGKGSTWRTTPSQQFRNNFDEIFRKNAPAK